MFGFYKAQFVAYLIYQGVEPLTIKERLGHKDIQMTLNTYGHLYLVRSSVYEKGLKKMARA